MKKRILSIVLATLLIVAMAIPASATSISTGRTWNGVLYQTNDTCDTDSFYCVIESSEMDYSLKTNVEVYTTVLGLTSTHYGSPSTLISTIRGSSEFTISYIYAYHFLNGNQASLQKVYAS